jgi:sulfur-carrier protein
MKIFFPDGGSGSQPECCHRKTNLIRITKDHPAGRLRMITIRVRTILTLKRILGKGEVELPVQEGTTLRELLAMIVDRYGDEMASRVFEPKTRTVLPYIRLMVNGRDIAFLDRMETILRDGDDVLILPPVSGG